LINSNGAELLAPIYQDISEEAKEYYATKSNDKWGLYDSAFVKILDHKFSSVSIEEDGISIEQDGAYSILSFDGKSVITDMVFSECTPLTFLTIPESENQEAAELENIINRICKGWTIVFNENGAGLMRDSDQRLVIPCRYSEIKAISENIFRCELQNASGYIFIDRLGQIVH
jgi:hypothetical protein